MTRICLLIGRFPERVFGGPLSSSEVSEQGTYMITQVCHQTAHAQSYSDSEMVSLSLTLLMTAFGQLTVRIVPERIIGGSLPEV